MPQAQARSLKSDESFVEKLAMGAIGAKRVLAHLRQMGHTPVALDRGSMSYKLWKRIKIKRLRVPDILCVNTGVKVESRAKTKLEISMSHSTSDPERGWDFGLDDEDYVAMPFCEKTGEEPIDWSASDLVQYVKVADLRHAYEQGKVVQQAPKGAQEGFETRLTWPASAASANGIVSEITDTRLKFKRQGDGRTISLSLTKKGIALASRVEEGNAILRGQFVCSIVPIHQCIPVTTPVGADHYLGWIASPSLIDRYAAAKALESFDEPKAQRALRAVLHDSREHIYVKLEAAASLARSGDDEGVEFLQQAMSGEYLEHRLESVIVLGEIDSPKSAQLLIGCLLDQEQHPEIRAGAAWSLGELQSKEGLDALVQSFQEVELSVRVEAARALAKLAREYRPSVLARFPSSPPSSRPGIAWALAQVGGLSVQDMLPLRVDDDARHWIAYMIGTQSQENYVADIAQLEAADPEVYFAVNVLWKILTSWIDGLREY